MMYKNDSLFARKYVSVIDTGRTVLSDDDAKPLLPNYYVVYRNNGQNRMIIDATLSNKVSVASE